MSEPRRSSRLQSKQQLVSYDENAPNGEEDQHAPTIHPQRKRAKTTKANVQVADENAYTNPKGNSVVRVVSTKKKRGKLAGLSDMPIDILYEVRSLLTTTLGLYVPPTF